MKKSMEWLAFCAMIFAPVAGAYEYPLQFTPNPGYRGLVVAGYSFDKNGTEVVGNCSYYTVSESDGPRGSSHGATKTYAQTCRWDLYGNLNSITPGAPAVPTSFSKDGTKTIYAINGYGESTGTDSKLSGRGFVSTPGAHYTWLTSMNNAVLHQFVYTLTFSLESDGDIPLNITATAASALQGVVTTMSSTCDGQISPGDKCSITLTYDPTKLTSSTGLASDTLRIDVNSNAGDPQDFVQNLTVVLASKEN